MTGIEPAGLLLDRVELADECQRLVRPRGITVFGFVEVAARVGPAGPFVDGAVRWRQAIDQCADVFLKGRAIADSTVGSMWECHWEDEAGAAPAEPHTTADARTLI